MRHHSSDQSPPHPQFDRTLAFVVLLGLFLIALMHFSEWWFRSFVDWWLLMKEHWHRLASSM